MLEGMQRVVVDEDRDGTLARKVVNRVFDRFVNLRMCQCAKVRAGTTTGVQRRRVSIQSIYRACGESGIGFALGCIVSRTATEREQRFLRLFKGQGYYEFISQAFWTLRRSTRLRQGSERFTLPCLPNLP